MSSIYKKTFAVMSMLCVCSVVYAQTAIVSQNNSDSLIHQSFADTTQEKLLYPITDKHTNLQEVVVSVGYGSQTKKQISGSVATISPTLIKERPIIDIGQAIQGNVAGVQVVAPSGKPGTQVNVIIRGGASISGGNDPLYVIDGVPTTDPSVVNPSDIESISILKDAASASIYGSRATNGVILITTKRGGVGTTKPVFSFTSYVGMSSVINQISVLDNKQYQSLINSMYGTSTISDAVAKINNKWQDLIYQIGVEQNYQLSVLGGDKDNNYYFSLGYQDQKGIVAPSKFERWSGRLNTTHTITPWFKIATNATYIQNNSKDVTDNKSSARGGFVMSALTSPPTIGKYLQDGVHDGQIGYNAISSWVNPFGSTEGSTSNTSENRLLGNLTLEFKLWQTLLLKSSWGIDASDKENRYYLDPWKTADGRTQGGVANVANTRNVNIISDQYLDYSFKKDKHKLTALVGISLQTNEYNYRKANVDHFLINATALVPEQEIETLISQTKKDYLTNTIDKSSWVLFSYIARLTYNYDLKYLLTLNFRADQSSKFLSNNRMGYFPSVSVGWNISRENFFNSMREYVNELKIRVGWGITGNQEGIGPYDKYSRVSYSNGTSSVSYVAPQNLTWEKTQSMNIGLDISILKSRIDFTAEYYYKKTKDVLVYFPIPSGAVVNNLFMNIGSMQNYGMEFTVNSKNIITQNFTWNTNFNISFNKNTVLDLANNVSMVVGDIYERGGATLLQSGVGLGTLYGYNYQGVNPTTGKALYEDVNKDGKISDADRVILGSALPDFIYGMTNTLTYKNFSLTIFLQGTHGNKIFNATRIETEGMVNSVNQSTRVLNRWQKVGDITDVPATSKGDIYNSQISSRFLEDGSFLRIKTITLSYNIPTQLLKKIHISSATVYVTAQNVYTFTKYLGYDPEVSSYGNTVSLSAENRNNDLTNRSVAQGIDNGAYPQIRTFIFGFKFNF